LNLGKLSHLDNDINHSIEIELLLQNYDSRQICTVSADQELVKIGDLPGTCRDRNKKTSVETEVFH
jgi:hypothetical protein